MFTGIIETTGRVVRAGRRLAVDTGYEDLVHGESVAVSGVCLTVVRAPGGVAEFDVVAETRKKTTLGSLKRGGRVNLERAVLAGTRLSGHVVQGHVDGTGRVTALRPLLRVETPLAAQLVPKGSVAVDGVSLTVVDAEPRAFTVALIPVTKRITTLGRLRKGDRVNVEVDVLLKAARRPSRITPEFLRRAGF